MIYKPDLSGHPQLDHLLAAAPPAELYHYTRKRGFGGIINSKSIWTTHHQFLDDDEEFIYFRDFLLEEVKAYKGHPRAPTSKVERVLEGNGFSPGGLDKSLNIFSASFSEHPDNTRLFRKYGDIALCFKLSEISLEPSRHFRIARCVYEAREQRSVARGLIDLIVQQFKSGAGDAPSMDFTVKRTLHLFAPMMKNPKRWRYQNEWRIVSDPINNWIDRHEPPLDSSGHRAVATQRNDGTLPLTEVRLSKAILSERNYIRSFLNAANLRSVPVRKINP